MKLYRGFKLGFALVLFRALFLVNQGCYGLTGGGGGCGGCGGRLSSLSGRGGGRTRVDRYRYAACLEQEASHADRSTERD